MTLPGQGHVADRPVTMPSHVRQVSVGSLATNCYLLTSPSGVERDCVVIDPGDEGPTILKLVRSQSARLAMVCLTHGHADHIGGLPQLLSAYPECEVAGSSTALEWLGDPDRNLSTWVGSRLVVLPRVTRALVDGAAFGVGDIRLRAISVPGHTSGCMAFHLDPPAVGPDQTGAPPVLFSGDALFRGTVGRTDLPGGSWAALAVSLAALARQLSPETVILPGHGQPSHMAWELEHNEYVRQALTGGAAGG
jgi:glyoxylase-like metal-dependent hydrolase (beta-lactamase superfamily II)